MTATQATTNGAAQAAEAKPRPAPRPPVLNVENIKSSIEEIKKEGGPPPWNRILVKNDRSTVTFIYQLPGTKNDHHYHLEDEWWYIAEGQLAWEMEGHPEPIRVSAGDFVFAPANHYHLIHVLEATGQRENTLVVFTSDHGEMLGDHQLMLKGPMVYEGAVHVPLILNWRGTLPQGERRTGFASLVDLAATSLDTAGLPNMQRSQGTSLLPVARGEAPGHDYALCEYRDSGHPYDPPVHVTMLRRGSHKLVVHHGAPATDRPRTGELFNLEADPQELTNLWSDPQSRELRTDLQEYLLDTLVALEDRSQPREAYW